MARELTRRRFVEAGGAALAAAYTVGGRRPARAADTSVALRGLSAPGEILVDRYGIPHIYAATQPDAFLLQGYNAARDRLWQIDLWRRRGLGRLSAALGKDLRRAGPRGAAVPLPRRPRARVRRLRRRRAADRHRVRRRRQRLHRRDRGRTRQVPGRVRGARLPPGEVGARGRRAHPQPRARLQPVRPGGPRAHAARLRPQGGARCARSSSRSGATRSPRGSTWTSIPDDVLDVYELAIASVEFGEVKASAAKRSLKQGSNNWTISGRRTASGRPDPRQRPAPHPGRAVAALPRAPQRARAERDRRRRARAARASRSATTRRSPSA